MFLNMGKSKKRAFALLKFTIGRIILGFTIAIIVIVLGLVWIFKSDAGFTYEKTDKTKIKVGLDQ